MTGVEVGNGDIPPVADVVRVVRGMVVATGGVAVVVTRDVLSFTNVTEAALVIFPVKSEIPFAR